MPRLFSPAALAAFCCAAVAAAQPGAPAPRPRTLPVAPMPHLPRKAPEKDPTNEDIDIKIDAALPQLGRIDPKVPAPPATDPAAVLGIPVVPDGPGVDPGTGAAKSLPGPFAGRTGAVKAKLMKDGGANADSEKAVALGLAWLAKQQKADGGWAFDVGRTEERACATGFALLPFLGAGITNKKPKDEAKEFKDFDKVVAKGLGFLTKQCPLNGVNAGRMSTDVYANGIAALALCEAYGVTGDAALKPHAQAAVNFIQKTQGPNGSWGYGNAGNGDTSIVGWQLQALFAAKRSKGLVVDDKVVAKANKFLDLTAAGAKKSMYGYNDSAGAAPGTSLTAIGLLSRHRHDGWGPLHPGLVDGVAGLMKNPPAGTGAVRNMYYYYYATLAVRAAEGEDWKTWNEGKKGPDGARTGGMRDWLAAAQVKKDENNLGSWDPEAGFIGAGCGRLGTTCVCLLTLEVYYRYTPLYKFDADGKPVKVVEDKK